MPEKDEILIGLQSIVSQYTMYAVLWHILFFAISFAIVAGWKPTNRTAIWILALPLLSVAVFSFITGNPFNGIYFIALAWLSFIAGFIVSPRSVRTATLTNRIIGVVMVLFGLVYPHFLEPGSYFQYLYASPAGLLPCPTLSIIIGFLIYFEGFTLGRISLIYILTGLFYGIFGVMKLGVLIDLFLVLGSLTLLIQLFFLRIKSTAEIKPQ